MVRKKERETNRGEYTFFNRIEDLSNRRKGKVVWKDEYKFTNMNLEKGKNSRMITGESGCKCHCVNRGEAGSI